jgi:hypothetical protein
VGIEATRLVISVKFCKQYHGTNFGAHVGPGQMHGEEDVTGVLTSMISKRHASSRFRPVFFKWCRAFVILPQISCYKYTPFCF